MIPADKSRITSPRSKTNSTIQDRQITNRLPRRNVATIAGAGGWCDVLVLDGLPVFGIQRLATTEDHVARQPELRRQLVHEWILLGQEVRDALIRRAPLERGYARWSDRRNRRCRCEEALRDDVRLGEVDWILDDNEHSHDVAVPEEA